MWRRIFEASAYPVISLTMKSAKQLDYDMAYASIIDEIANEYRRHSYILKSDKFMVIEKERF